MKKAILAALVCTLAMPMAHAAPIVAQQAQTDATSAQARLNALLKDIKSIDGSFSQSMGKSVFSGKFSAQRPNKLRWQIERPSEQLTVLDGASYWFYDKDFNQAIKQKISDDLAQTPALLLSGDISKMTQNFNITQPDVSKNYFVLTPKKSGAFTNLAISFNNKKPALIVMTDVSGQTSKITLSNVRINAKQSAALYQFKAPAGVEVFAQ